VSILRVVKGDVRRRVSNSKNQECSSGPKGLRPPKGEVPLIGDARGEREKIGRLKLFQP